MTEAHDNYSTRHTTIFKLPCDCGNYATLSIQASTHPAAVSDLRIQIQTDARYGEFANHASRREVLGLDMPVARIEDILQGKIWAIQDPDRRASKRQKDLADIARIIEAYPEMKARVPAEVLSRLVA